MSWYLTVVRKYATFDGRARRAEYWMFGVVSFLITIALVFADGALGTISGRIGMLTLVYSLAMLLPSLAVTVRRLHDTGRSGWWVLLAFIPVLGMLALLVFMLIDGTRGDNQFGPSPKAALA